MNQGGGAVEEDRESDDDQGWREDAPNPTQESIGEGEERPADVSWREGEWGERPEEGDSA